MFINERSQDRRAFALVEFVVVVAILLLACLVAFLLASDTRRRSRLAGSIQNLQQLGKGAGGFAADHENRIYSLSWAPGVHECNGYVFPESGNYNEAAADQAVCIMRELGGRTDMLDMSAWFPHLLYNHLVLSEYLGDTLPSPMVVSPGDAARLAWQRAVTQDPNDPNTPYFALECRPGGNGNADRRWPYSSSYEMPPSLYAPDAIIFLPEGGTIPTVAQDPFGHRWFTVGTAQTVLGNRRMDEVRFPSNKVMLHEGKQSLFGSREIFFMDPEARVPLLLVDGSAGVRSTSTANPGFFPNTPMNRNPTRVLYQPETTWEAPASHGGTSQILNGVIRWTRSGLRGRDYMGPEVEWVQ